MPYKEQAPITRFLHGFFSNIAQEGLPRYADYKYKQKLMETERKHEQKERERLEKSKWDYMAKKWQLDREAEAKREMLKMAGNERLSPRTREGALNLYQSKNIFAPESIPQWNFLKNSMTIGKQPQVAPKQPTPIHPARIRQMATNLAISTLKSPQCQQLLSTMDTQSRMKFERDLASYIERYTSYLMQGGEFKGMEMSYEQWEEYIGE